MALKKGSKGASVSDLQVNLTRLGYLTNADGVFGPQTVKNLKAFQADNSLKADGLYGALTEKTLLAKVAALGKSKLPTPVSKGETPWMDWLERNKGQKEIPGSKANPFIIDTFKYTSLKNMKIALTDETAWCAALANAALVKNGYKGTNSAAAASFNKLNEIDKPIYGCIVTLPRKGGSGYHVTFYTGKNPQGRLNCLGGNQGNALKDSVYSIEGARFFWPEKAAA